MPKFATMVAIALGLLPQTVLAQTILNSPNVNLTVSLGSEAANPAQQGLSGMEIKRMDHYSGQALAAVYAFGAAVGNQGDAIAELRAKVLRLVEAGQRCGKSADQTAEYFEIFSTLYANGAVPGVLLDGSGQLDAKQLFTSVITFYENAAPRLVDVEAIEARDLAAIRAVATSNTAPVFEVQAPEPMVAVAEIKPAAPTIPENASPAVRAILERVWLDGEDWMIEVKQGDSLGQFAAALYGDTLQFRFIFEANRDQLSTPNGITVGQDLMLPKNL